LRRGLIENHNRRLLADRPMLAFLIIAVSPILKVSRAPRGSGTNGRFRHSARKGPLNASIRIVGWFAGPRVVERDTVSVRPIGPGRGTQTRYPGCTRIVSSSLTFRPTLSNTRTAFAPRNESRGSSAGEKRERHQRSSATSFIWCKLIAAITRQSD
jgi:hypothetical protein